MTDHQKPVAIVTGISKGLGAEIARDLVAAGWHVVGNGRDSRTLSAAVETLGAPGTITAIAGDTTDPEHLRSLVTAAVEAGDLRLVVNNAAVIGPSGKPHLIDFPVDELSTMLAINVVAPLRLDQLALTEAHPSVLVNISSDAHLAPYEGWGGYGSTKAAMEHLTAVLALENPQVKVYSLDPGPMATDMLQSALVGNDLAEYATPAERAGAVRVLVETLPPSGRYVARDVLDSAIR